MMKRSTTKKRICDVVLNAITAVMAMLFLVSACALDSESCIPCVCCAVTVAWLALMAIKADRR